MERQTAGRQLALEARRIHEQSVQRYVCNVLTTEQLDAARHRTDLTPSDTVWVNLDHGQHGIGSQSCGPGPLPQYFLRAERAEFSFVLSETS